MCLKTEKIKFLVLKVEEILVDILVFKFPEMFSTHGNTMKQTRNFMVFKKKMESEGGKKKKMDSVLPHPRQLTFPRASGDDK
jgi:hypothetical protein